MPSFAIAPFWIFRLPSASGKRLPAGQRQSNSDAALSYLPGIDVQQSRAGGAAARNLRIVEDVRIKIERKAERVFVAL